MLRPRLLSSGLRIVGGRGLRPCNFFPLNTNRSCRTYLSMCTRNKNWNLQFLSGESLRKLSNLPSFTDIPAVFDRIKQVSNPAIVKKVNAVYVFDVEGEGKWHVDLTSGSGEIGQGPPTNKPDVTVVVNKENFLKMFNRELKPATAFMSGKLKLSGDLSKALALESVMKASREEF